MITVLLIFTILVIIDIVLNIRTFIKFKKTKQIIPIEYIEKTKLNTQCWVKALDRLNIIRTDPEITEAAMVLGLRNEEGHAWIEYKRKNEIIQYDPTTEKIITTNNGPTKTKLDNKNNIIFDIEL